MGLQGQLNDVSSDSIPILFIALIATCVSHLRAILTGLIHTVGLRSLPQPTSPSDHEGLLGLGSGLAGLIVLSEQFNLNNQQSYCYGKYDKENCVFCLSGLKDGERVRKLTCRHVFHKDCLDGWIDQMKFSCPLCRSPLVSECHVDHANRRVAHQLAAWFPVR